MPWVRENLGNEVACMTENQFAKISFHYIKHLSLEVANFYMQTAHRLLHTFTLRGGKAYWQGKGTILTGCFCPTLDTDALWSNKLGIPTTFTQGLFHWNLYPPPRPHPLVKDFLPPSLDQIKITFIPEDFHTIWVYQALGFQIPWITIFVGSVPEIMETHL